MLTRFFYTLREAGVPASVTEYLTLLEALQARVAQYSVDDFYFLARATLVKDEKHFDRFDRAFAKHFKGIEQAFEALQKELPDDWLKLLAQRQFTPEEMARIEALGGWDKLMETLKQRLEEQKGRHEGGNKWIGTGGTSPFGHGGYNPEGVRIGGAGGKGRAVKVWERRDYRNLDDQVELGTRNIKVALRKLRRFAREGAADQFDIDGTISATARNAGLLDLKFQPERHNALKLLLFFDVGGSMEAHVRVCEELFSAARSEFKHLEYFYFHNFVYESVWKDSRRRHGERTPLFEILRKYPPDYRVVFVGDASMSPYEIMQPGGSIEHWNDEAGAVWMQRITQRFQRHAWLNPEPEDRWDYVQSIGIARQLLGERMFPLTLRGLDDAIKALKA
ncbi:MAG TPA: VWA domain-containing protein [Steroidobacteraceae bacterium]|nr:VWA domain-containing protein [Steroidobacteraceae bacterium]